MMNELLGKVFNENCLETMAKMPNDFLDATITSPPYDTLRKYKGFEFNFEAIAQELYRVTNKGGVVVWVVGDETKNGSESGSSFRQALYFMDLGFRLHDTMIYKSSKPPLTHRRYEPEFEYMFVFSKGAPKTFNPIMVPTTYAGTRSDRPKTEKGSRSQNSAIRSREEGPRFVKPEKIKGNIWEYKTGGGHSTKDAIAFEHPAIFPEALAEDHIRSWTNQLDIVYDPFMGSGTVAKMCILLNRWYIGSEISPEYCEIIKERLDLIDDETLSNYIITPWASAA